MTTSRNIRKYDAVLSFDWADEKHDYCLFDAETSILETGSIQNRPEVIHDFICKIRFRFQGKAVAVGLEQSKGALAYQLMEYGFFTIYFAHPTTVAKVREAWTPSGAKDDPGDAELIMGIVRDTNHKLRAWKPDTPETHRLMLLCSHRRKLVDLRVKLTNMLRSCLKTYYPLACRVAGDKLNEPLALNFLTRWPTFESLKRSRLSTVESFYTHGNSRSSKAVQERLEAIRDAEPSTTDPVITECYSMQMLVLVAQIRQIQESIKQYDKEIHKTYCTHADAEIIDSFPATGKVFGPRLIAALGTDRDRFESAHEIECYSGIAPVVDRSGKTAKIYRRYKCSAFIRQSFHEWANETTKHCLWARAFYVQAREKGMGHHQAVRSLAYKWIRIIYKCWKNQIPYDDGHYMSMLKKRGSGLMKLIAEHPDVYRLNGPIKVQF
jgi:transposase